MTVSNFNFKGHNRYIVIVPASASTPAGFQLLTFEQNNNVSEIINEISPHLVRDRNALIYARSLVMNAGVNLRQFNPGLWRIIPRRKWLLISKSAAAIPYRC